MKNKKDSGIENKKSMNLKLNDKRKKNRLEYEEKVKEQGMKQEGEISQLKETTRLEREEREEQWNRKQK